MKVVSVTGTSAAETGEAHLVSVQRYGLDIVGRWSEVNARTAAFPEPPEVHNGVVTWQRAAGPVP